MTRADIAIAETMAMVTDYATHFAAVILENIKSGALDTEARNEVYAEIEARLRKMLADERAQCAAICRRMHTESQQRFEMAMVCAREIEKE